MPEETLYVVCLGCGEAFDDLVIAKQHEADSKDPSCTSEGYEILPESEAM